MTSHNLKSSCFSQPISGASHQRSIIPPNHYSFFCEASHLTSQPQQTFNHQTQTQAGTSQTLSMPIFPRPDTFHPSAPSFSKPKFSTIGSDASKSQRDPEGQSLWTGFLQGNEAVMNLLDTEISKKKRGKYKIYTEEEKAQIVEHAKTYGIEQTLEEFSGPEHRLDQRKLAGWIECSEKPKVAKGRKSGDTNRDHALYRWCCQFEKEHGRPPTRKEAGIHTLKLSNNPKFKASKGYLDKFGKKFNIEFTPIKVFSNRKRKGSVESDATASTNNTPMAEMMDKMISSLANFVQDRQTDSCSLEKVGVQVGEELPLTKKQSSLCDLANELVEEQTTSEIKKTEDDLIDQFFSDFNAKDEENVHFRKFVSGWEEDFVYENRQNFMFEFQSE